MQHLQRACRGLVGYSKLGVCHDHGQTGLALCLWAVLVTTVVTIFRFTITPTIAVVCFRWDMFSGSIGLTTISTVCIVLVAVTGVVTILGFNPHQSY
jgi:hypothetical protein